MKEVSFDVSSFDIEICMTYGCFNALFIYYVRFIRVAYSYLVGVKTNRQIQLIVRSRNGL